MKKLPEDSVTYNDNIFDDESINIIDDTNLDGNFTDMVNDIDSPDWMTALPDAYRSKLRHEYKSWLKSKKDSNITEDEIRTLIMKDLEFRHMMSVEEYTLYRKWEEIQTKFEDKSKNFNVSEFLYETRDTPNANVNRLKNELWIPNDISDYLKLVPKLELCNDNANKNRDWNILRTFTHTQINNSNIGRNLFFIVYDEITNKVIGLINVSSDFMDLTPRDKYIGWTREQKTSKRMINHTAIGSTILPMQPLGYNYLGGKLIALLTISDYVEQKWNEKYDTKNMPSKLVGMTTTSLYSSFSQYNNLMYWNKRGHTAGSIKFEVHKNTLDKIKLFLQREYPLQYWEWYIATEPQGMPLKRDFKQRSLSFIYTKLKIEKKYYETNHSRGIYFCPFYDNMKEYLRMEISEDKLVRRKDFNNDIMSLTNIWKEKYATKRVNNIIEQGKEFSRDILYYDDMIYLTWEETKKKYLPQVGR